MKNSIKMILGVSIVSTFLIIPVVLAEQHVQGDGTLILNGEGYANACGKGVITIIGNGTVNISGTDDIDVLGDTWQLVNSTPNWQIWECQEPTTGYITITSIEDNEIQVNFVGKCAPWIGQGIGYVDFDGNGTVVKYT
ncbi:MAG: hypothetical protein DRO67_03675 [Candidatus Asgardarchaeum californiense]|nr:MAG: hypothetical protein DRO67_03675 [Candidatus Asgardarchaeum californiense]